MFRHRVASYSSVVEELETVVVTVLINLYSHMRGACNDRRASRAVGSHSFRDQHSSVQGLNLGTRVRKVPSATAPVASDVRPRVGLRVGTGDGSRPTHCTE